MSTRKSPDARTDYVDRRLTERERGNERKAARKEANETKGRTK